METLQTVILNEDWIYILATRNQQARIRTVCVWFRCKYLQKIIIMMTVPISYPDNQNNICLYYIWCINLLLWIPVYHWIPYSKIPPTVGFARHNSILTPMNNSPLVGCACAGRANLEQHQCTIRLRISGSAMHGIATYGKPREAL